jgi:hypothetical protein
MIHPFTPCIGRTELAVRYFPYIQPSSAWRKLRALMLEQPRLRKLASLRRRWFTQAEAELIDARMNA